MASGLATSETGGVIDPTDVRGAGAMEWAELVGVPVDHPLVGASGSAAYNVEYDWGRVVTTPEGQVGPASDVIATPENGGINQHAALGHWRELLNLKGSPAPWMLLLILGVIFLVHFSFNVEGGAFGRHVRAGAAAG